MPKKKIFSKIVAFSMSTILVLSFLQQFFLQKASAANVKNDESFSGDGYMFWDKGDDFNEEANSIIIDKNGKYVITGYVSNGNNLDVAVWRFNEDGNADTTFGTSGFISFDNLTSGSDSSDDEGFDIVQQSDGKYIIVGYSVYLASDERNDCDMFALRLNEDGTIDPSFGADLCPGAANGDGCFVHHNAAGGERGDRSMAVAIQNDGKIVIAGHSYHGGDGDVGEDADMVIWRLNSNGQFDSSFGDGTCFNGVGQDGKYGCIVNVNSRSTEDGWQKGIDIAIQSDGKIVVGGWSFDYDSEGGEFIGNGDAVIWRYNSNGTMDASFGNGTCSNGVGPDGKYGCVVHGMASGGDFCDKIWGIAIDNKGRIVASGQSANENGNADMAIWRYTSSGQLDTTFNGVGYLTHHNAAGGNSGDRANDIAIDQSGKYVVTGRSRSQNGTQDMVVWRIKENGTLDETFGDGSCSNGVGESLNKGCIVRTNITSTSSLKKGSSIIIDNLGRYIVAGSSYDGTSFNLAVWRFENEYVIKGLDSSFEVLVNGTDVKDGSGEGSSGNVVVTIKKDGIVIAQVLVKLFEDLDWTGLTAGASTTDFKAFIHDIASLTDSLSFSLYVPYREGDKGVGICPGATSLDAVSVSCPNLVYKTDEDEGVVIVEFDGKKYWRVQVTGSGGFSTSNLPTTGSNMSAITVLSSLLLVLVGLKKGKRFFIAM